MPAILALLPVLLMSAPDHIAPAPPGRSHLSCVRETALELAATDLADEAIGDRSLEVCSASMDAHLANMPGSRVGASPADRETYARVRATTRSVLRDVAVIVAQQARGTFIARPLKTAPRL
jgi:hypothetical protein